MTRVSMLLCVFVAFIGVLFATSRKYVSSDPSPFLSKIVHLDLKGAPLNILYLEKVFPLLRELGATGLLVEYEDMFPYSGILQNLTAKNHYSRRVIKRLLDAADKNKLTVIPLVQTFGHLEFALKLPDYMLLREVFETPQVVCPSFPPSVLLIKDMLSQVAELHKGRISHIHIGSDEVYVIGKCSRCKQRMCAHNWTTDDLFLDHVHTVASFVKSLDLQPIMWDDMFRKIDTEILKKQSLTKIVEVMVWAYRGVGQNIHNAMEKYAVANFSGIWVASAFKGAAGPTNQLPKYQFHLTNHIAWVQLVLSFQNKLNLRGIALTGWQRFDHFGALCELFPTGIPVLALCLKYLDTGMYDQKTLADIQKVLNCNNPILLNSTRNPPLMSCKYPGARTFEAVQQFGQIQNKRASMESTNYYMGWLSPMNIAHNFSSPSYVSKEIAMLAEILKLLSTVAQNIKDLRTVADDATLQEWLETFWQPQMQWAHRLQEDSRNLLAQKTWPRRPFYI